MSELMRAVRVAGLGKLLGMRWALQWGWEGLIRGHCLTRVIQTSLKIGLLEGAERAGWLDAREFAAGRGLDPDLVHALCDYLYARGVLARKQGRYGLDEPGRLLMQSELLQGWFELVDGYEPVLHGLEPLVRGEA